MDHQHIYLFYFILLLLPPSYSSLVDHVIRFGSLTPTIHANTPPTDNDDHQQRTRTTRYISTSFLPFQFYAPGDAYLTKPPSLLPPSNNHPLLRLVHQACVCLFPDQEVYYLLFTPTPIQQVIPTTMRLLFAGTHSGWLLLIVIVIYISQIYVYRTRTQSTVYVQHHQLRR